MSSGSELNKWLHRVNNIMGMLYVRAVDANYVRNVANTLASESESMLAHISRPPIVCLCGSTRFSEAFREANLRETLAGKIVLTIGCDMKSDDEIWHDKTPEQLEGIKAELDQLHLQKIKLADEVLILNVGGYIGESTRRELEFAQELNKAIRFLE